MPRPFSRHEKSVRPELLDRQERGMSRRKFLSLGAAGLFAADMLSGELLWSGTTPKIRTYDNPEAQRKFPDTYTLVVGGFGIARVGELAGAVDACLADYGQVAYIKNANEDFSIKDIKRETRQFVKESGVGRLRLYGHSMGGMVATELAADLTGDVDIEALILDCSPAHYRDVREQEQFGTWMLALCDELSLRMGPLSRFGMEALRPLLDGRDDYLEICQHALSKISKESCSNALIQGQASYLRAFDVEDFAGAIPDTTHVIRLRPDNYDHDGTVNNETSLPRWREGLQHEVVDRQIKGGAHASPRKDTKAYAKVLRDVAETYAFYDGSPAR